MSPMGPFRSVLDLAVAVSYLVGLFTCVGLIQFRRARLPRDVKGPEDDVAQRNSISQNNIRCRLGIFDLSIAGGMAFMAGLLFASIIPSANPINIFGFLHVIYLNLVIVVPALGLSLLVADRFRSGRLLNTSSRGLSVLGLAAFGVGIYATLIEPYRLRVESAQMPIPTERAGDDPIRIAILADLQTDRIGTYEQHAIATLMEQRPDLILITGDMLQGWDVLRNELEALRLLLSELDAPGGVYLVQGDTDRGCAEKNHPPTDQGYRAYLESLVVGTQVRVLYNEVVTTQVCDRSFRIGGVGLDFQSENARSRVIEPLTAVTDPEEICLLMTHRPDVVFLLPDSSRVDLVVAGHTHGGQVVVPGYGPPITLSNVPRSVAAGGLHKIGGNLIYVSRGVGHERGQAPRIRFLCPPEISIITLHD